MHYIIYSNLLDLPISIVAFTYSSMALYNKNEFLILINMAINVLKNLTIKNCI